MRGQAAETQWEFVRRAAKATVCALMPEEIAFFDVIWQACAPLVWKLPPGTAADERAASALMDRVGGLALAAPWAREAELLEVPLFLMLKSSLHQVMSTGRRSSEDVGKVVAANSLRTPLPQRFCRLVQLLVAEFCGAVAEPDPETEEFLRRALASLPHGRWYFVFHDGEEYCYEGSLPKAVLGFREKAMFWLNWVERDFRSRNRPRQAAGQIGPQAELVLRFLSRKENAGRTVTFDQIWRAAWSRPPPVQSKMKGSIEVEISRLHTFALKKFEGHDKTKCKVCYPEKEAHQYEIAEDMPQECCIVRARDLPE